MTVHEDNALLRRIDNQTGTLTLNRPEKGNTLSPGLLLALHLTLQEWAQEDAVRAVVITGNSDKAFSAGYDIAAIPSDITPEMAEILKNNNPLELALNSVRQFPYPVIAMLNGYCFGAGLNLAMCCDMRFGADHIKAGMPPARLGLVYHPEGLKQFIEVIGAARTREVFFSARTYVGPELKTMGLVDHLLPKARLADAVYQLAAEIARNAPLSLKGMKAIINMLTSGPLMTEIDLQKAEAIIAAAFDSDDLKEGQIAFLEKRKPEFKGR